MFQCKVYYALPVLALTTSRRKSNSVVHDTQAFSRLLVFSSDFPRCQLSHRYPANCMYTLGTPQGTSPGAGLESAFDQADAAFADLIVTSVDSQGVSLEDEVGFLRAHGHNNVTSNLHISGVTLVAQASQDRRQALLCSLFTAAVAARRVWSWRCCPECVHQEQPFAVFGRNAPFFLC